MFVRGNAKGSLGRLDLQYGIQSGGENGSYGGMFASKLHHTNGSWMRINRIFGYLCYHHMKLKITIVCLMAMFLGSATAQYRYAGKVLGFSREYNPYPRSWCAAQALGAPNVYPQYDDIDGAWTAEDYGDQRDTLILGFDNNSPIDSILIWETSGAGIIDSVYVLNPNTNQWVLVFGRKGQNYPKAGDTLAHILRIGFPMTSFNVNAVRIELANDSAKDWAEIDAVAIHPQTLTPTTYSSLAGNCATFDGVDDYYRTTQSAMAATRNNAFTLMCWAKITADTAPKVSRVGRGAGIIYDANYNYFGITLANLGTGDSMYAFVDGDNTDEIAMPFVKNTWQHIAMTCDKDSLRVYVNGTMAGVTQGSTFDSLDSYGLLEFGRNYGNQSYFKGSLDEVKMYNRVLTASEIMQQTYKIGEGAVNANLIGYWQFNQTDSGSLNAYTHRTDSLHNGGIFEATGSILAVKHIAPSSIGLYPNPSNGTAHLILDPSIHGARDLRVFTLQGREVWHTQLDFVSGKSEIHLNTLPSGNYLLLCAGATVQMVVE